MFTRLYGLPKERQTAFSNNACSCLRCASCVKRVLIKRIFLSAPVWIIEEFTVQYIRMKDGCGFLLSVIRGTFVQS